MKMLLTGSSGFIGQHLTPGLEKNFQLHHLKSDLTDHKAVNEEVALVKPNIIVHLAARTETLIKMISMKKQCYHYTGFISKNY